MNKFTISWSKHTEFFNDKCWKPWRIAIRKSVSDCRRKMSSKGLSFPQQWFISPLLFKPPGAVVWVLADVPLSLAFDVLEGPQRLKVQNTAVTHQIQEDLLPFLKNSAQCLLVLLYDCFLITDAHWYIRHASLLAHICLFVNVISLSVFSS